jgi:hypothetical protein
MWNWQILVSHGGWRSSHIIKRQKANYLSNGWLQNRSISDGSRQPATFGCLVRFTAKPACFTNILKLHVMLDWTINCKLFSLRSSNSHLLMNSPVWLQSGLIILTCDWGETLVNHLSVQTNFSSLPKVFVCGRSWCMVSNHSKASKTMMSSVV